MHKAVKLYMAHKFYEYKYFKNVLEYTSTESICPMAKYYKDSVKTGF